MVTAKDMPAVRVEVPKEFAAGFLLNQLDIDPDKREVLQLKLGNADLGKWQVLNVETVRHNAGYFIAMATLRQIW